MAIFYFKGNKEEYLIFIKKYDIIYIESKKEIKKGILKKIKW